MLSKKVLLFLVALYLFGAFLHLGRMYLHREEPRRCIIAMEMNYTGNYLEPHVLGRPYFKKPPLHNIVLAIMFKIFGMNEWTARSVSVVSMFIISILIFFLTKEIVGFEAALFGAFAFGLAFLSYFEYGMLAETDMFFSLLVFASMICIYKKRLFLGSVLAGFALLTKGFPALHYFYLTLLSYAFVKKRLKKTIFSKSVIFGAVFIFVLFFGWLATVSKGNIHRFDYALGMLLQASGGRVLSVERVGETLIHMIKFPFSFFFAFFPLGLFFMIFLKKEFRLNFFETLKKNANIKELCLFSISAFLPNFAIYWIIPDARTRYTLVLFGVLALVLAVFYYVFESLEDFNFKRLFTWLFVAIVFFGIISTLFDLDFLKGRDYYISLAVVILATIFYGYTKRQPTEALTLLVAGIGFTVLLKVLTITTYDTYLYTYYENYRKDGKDVAKILLSKGAKYVMTDGGTLRLFVYVEKYLGMPLHPYNKRRHGFAVVRDKSKLKKIFVRLELPDHIYYVGRT